MRDNLWFTYKARIQAHSRLAGNDFHSQLLLVWYALASTGLAIVVVKWPDILGKNTDVLSAILSVALLAISMAVAGRDFRGRSIEMRRNYQSLHALYTKTEKAGDLSEADLAEYHVLLDSVENHTTFDDKLARVLNRRGLTSRKPSRAEIAEAYGGVVIRVGLLVALYAAPLALLGFR